MDAPNGTWSLYVVDDAGDRHRDIDELVADDHGRWTSASATAAATSATSAATTATAAATAATAAATSATSAATSATAATSAAAACRHLRHPTATATTAAAAATATSPPPPPPARCRVPRVLGLRLERREAQDPGGSLLGRQGASRSFAPLAARPRGEPVTAARHDQAPELPGEAGGRPVVNDEAT